MEKEINNETRFDCPYSKYSCNFKLYKHYSNNNELGFCMDPIKL